MNRCDPLMCNSFWSKMLAALGPRSIVDAGIRCLYKEYQQERSNQEKESSLLEPCHGAICSLIASCVVARFAATLRMRLLTYLGVRLRLDGLTSYGWGV